MYPHVRCTGCEEVLGEIWDDFKKDYDSVTDDNYSWVWKKYEIERLCCRNTMFSNFELWKIFPFSNS